MKATDLSIIVPCFNEADLIDETSEKLESKLSELIGKGKISPASRMVFIDDGSTDGTWQKIVEQCSRSNQVAGIKLSCNRGHQNAVLAGLLTVPGDAVISIDADLQDNIETIESMLDAHASGDQVVYGVRSERKSDSFFKRTFAELYYRVLLLMGVNVVFNHADFRLMDRNIINNLEKYEESNLFLRGIVPSIGFPSSIVTYERLPRTSGESKYPLRKVVSLAMDGITSFSSFPLRLVTILGGGIFLCTFTASVWVVLTWLFSSAVVPGWASSVLPIYFLGGVQLLCLGVIGEYVGKIYLETKRRPRYIIDQTLNVSASSDNTQ